MTLFLAAYLVGCAWFGAITVHSLRRSWRTLRGRDRTPSIVVILCIASMVMIALWPLVVIEVMLDDDDDGRGGAGKPREAS